MSQNWRKMAKMLHNAAKKFDWDSMKLNIFNFKKKLCRHKFGGLCILRYQDKTTSRMKASGICKTLCIAPEWSLRLKNTPRKLKGHYHRIRSSLLTYA